MYDSRSEKGAVLLLFVLVLIMGSGAALVRQEGIARFQGASDAALYLTAEQNLQRLNHAKQALLAAAVSYADNYGPRGSGPGHLPCPDLDPPDDGNPGNDGPDPPCGRAENQIGRVPRLTLATRSDAGQSATGETELLSTESISTTAAEHSELNRTKLLEFYPQLSFQDRQPWYVVDNAFINNPTNRIVNAETTTTLVDNAGREVVAALMTPGKEVSAWNQQRPSIKAADYIESIASTMGVNASTSIGNSNINTQLTITRDHQPNSNDQVIFIYRDELMPLVYRRVASYVVDLLLRKAENQCPFSVDSAVVEGAGADHGVITATSECMPTIFTVALNGEQERNVENSSCQSQVINDGARHVLGLEHCLELLIEDGTLEGTNANRHWLIKNLWPEYVALAIDNDCVRQVVASCVLTWRVDQLNADGGEGIEEGADGFSATGSMMSRVIRLHLKGEPNET